MYYVSCAWLSQKSAKRDKQRTSSLNNPRRMQMTEGIQRRNSLLARLLPTTQSTLCRWIGFWGGWGALTQASNSTAPSPAALSWWSYLGRKRVSLHRSHTGSRSNTQREEKREEKREESPFSVLCCTSTVHHCMSEYIRSSQGSFIHSFIMDIPTFPIIILVHFFGLIWISDLVWIDIPIISLIYLWYIYIYIYINTWNSSFPNFCFSHLNSQISHIAG